MTFGSLTQPPHSRVCFADRFEAGELLAQAVIRQIAEKSQIGDLPKIVYALPRGGLEVAAPIAQQLQCPLDVIVAKKITRPENPELAIGAVTSDGHTLWMPQNRSVREPEYINEIALHKARERAYAQYQEFEPNRPQVQPMGAISLIVDDGIATGMTMAVAVQALRAQNPAQIWICVPVAPPEMMEHLQNWADHVVVLATPRPFQSVSRFYREFNQVETATAIAQLRSVNR